MNQVGIGKSNPSLFGEIASKHRIQDPVRNTPAATKGVQQGVALGNSQAAPANEFQGALRGAMHQVLKNEVEAWLNTGDETVDATRAELLNVEGGKGSFKFEQLPNSVKKALLGLQDASEQLEAIFVKDLLSKMRQSSMSTEDSMYSDLAREMFDEQIAKQISSSPNSFGLAKSVFRQNALDTLRRSISSDPTQNP